MLLSNSNEDTCCLLNAIFSNKLSDTSSVGRYYFLPFTELLIYWITIIRFGEIPTFYDKSCDIAPHAKLDISVLIICHDIPLSCDNIKSYNSTH